jgi:hypothetical protein
MSALPLRTDIVGAVDHVRKVPETEVAASFNHFVGAGEQRGRDGEAEHLRGPKINNQLQLGRKLHGQIAGRCSGQDFLHVNCRTAKTLPQIDSIADQPAVHDMFAISPTMRTPAWSREKPAKASFISWSVLARRTSSRNLSLRAAAWASAETSSAMGFSRCKAQKSQLGQLGSTMQHNVSTALFSSLHAQKSHTLENRKGS